MGYPAVAVAADRLRCPQTAPSPPPPARSAATAPGAVEPGPSRPPRSPDSWGREGRGGSHSSHSRATPSSHAPPALGGHPGGHLHRTMKSLSSSRACPGSRWSNCSASTCRASRGSSGTSAPASSGLQELSVTRVPAGDAPPPCPASARRASPAWFQGRQRDGLLKGAHKGLQPLLQVTQVLLQKVWTGGEGMEGDAGEGQGAE